MLYLELGRLTPGQPRRDGSIGKSIGEITVCVGFGWKIESENTPPIASGTRPVQYQNLINQLQEATIVSVGLSSGGKEMQIVLSNAVNLTTKGSDPPEPEWSVSFNAPPMGHLHVEKGALRHDRRNS